MTEDTANVEFSWPVSKQKQICVNRCTFMFNFLIFPNIPRGHLYFIYSHHIRGAFTLRGTCLQTHALAHNPQSIRIIHEQHEVVAGWDPSKHTALDVFVSLFASRPVQRWRTSTRVVKPRDDPLWKRYETRCTADGKNGTDDVNFFFMPLHSRSFRLLPWAQK